VCVLVCLVDLAATVPDSRPAVTGKSLSPGKIASNVGKWIEVPGSGGVWKKINIRTFSLLLIFVLCGVCLGTEPASSPKPPEKERTCEGKTLGEWIALTKDKDWMAARFARAGRNVPLK
jgi:hypothetical protein